MVLEKEKKGEERLKSVADKIDSFFSFITSSVL